MDINLSVTPGGCCGRLYKGDSLKALLTGKRQIKRAAELLNVIKAKNIDASRCDGRFFSVFSLYLCEEKYFNIQLLYDELRRIS